MLVESRQDEDQDSDSSADGEVGLTKLLLNINGMDISITSPSAEEQHAILLTATMESLGRGISPWH